MNCQGFAAAANCLFVSDVAQTVLEQKGAIALPDYLINSGDLIYCAYQHGLVDSISSQIKQVGCSMRNYFCDDPFVLG